MRPDRRCPLRPHDHCTLCVPGATGPQDCPAVYLVMSDPELRRPPRGTAPAGAGRGGLTPSGCSVQQLVLAQLGRSALEQSGTVADHGVPELVELLDRRADPGRERPDPNAKLVAGCPSR